MGFWKKLFGKKEEEIKEDSGISPAQPSQPTTNLPNQREFLNETCSLCGGVIGTDKRKKVGGKIFHKKCFKEQYNQFKNQGKVY